MPKGASWAVCVALLAVTTVAPADAPPQAAVQAEQGARAATELAAERDYVVRSDRWRLGVAEALVASPAARDRLLAAKIFGVHKLRAQHLPQPGEPWIPPTQPPVSPQRLALLVRGLGAAESSDPVLLAALAGGGFEEVAPEIAGVAQQRLRQLDPDNLANWWLGVAPAPFASADHVQRAAAATRFETYHDARLAWFLETFQQHLPPHRRHLGPFWGYRVGGASGIAGA